MEPFLYKSMTVSRWWTQQKLQKRVCNQTQRITTWQKNAIDSHAAYISSRPYYNEMNTCKILQVSLCHKACGVYRELCRRQHESIRGIKCVAITKARTVIWRPWWWSHEPCAMSITTPIDKPHFITKLLITNHWAPSYTFSTPYYPQRSKWSLFVDQLRIRQGSKLVQPVVMTVATAILA